MKEKAQIVDVRDTEDFNKSHIPEATSIPLTELNKRYLELDQNSPIVIVCNRGGQKSQKALDLLREKGFTDVGILEGGIAAWEKRNN
jgi:rhodanese-related sulfurtransferase